MNDYISSGQIKLLYYLMGHTEILFTVQRYMKKKKLTFDKIEKSKGELIINKLQEVENKTGFWTTTCNANKIKGNLVICGQCSNFMQTKDNGDGQCPHRVLTLNGGDKAGFEFCFQYGDKEPITNTMRSTLEKDILTILGVD